MKGISFMLANYCARQVGWNMTEGWGQGDAASSAYFRPVETFAGRLDEYLSDVRALGFSAIDMWTGVMDPAWVTPEHRAIAQDLLRKHGLIVSSTGGWLGGTHDAF